MDFVVCYDVEATFRENEFNLQSLVQLAIASVRNSPARNAMRYLAQNIEQSIVTPPTYAYRDTILRRTRAADPTEAEARALSSMGRM